MEIENRMVAEGFDNHDPSSPWSREREWNDRVQYYRVHAARGYLFLLHPSVGNQALSTPFSFMWMYTHPNRGSFSRRPLQEKRTGTVIEGMDEQGSGGKGMVGTARQQEESEIE
ncbi:hypothetical protein L1887_34878 [Cichorium endivia]|nr:hypothetical protein L1887_34878 [Cichorium endivia]